MGASRLPHAHRRAHESGGHYTARNATGCEGYGCGGAYQLHARYAAEWAARLADDASWVEAQLALHGASAYAMVLFAHAEPTANHAAFMTRYRAAAGAWGKPVLHLMGDGHVWRMDRPWAEQNILRVEVQQGGVAQPIQVTVSATAAEPFTIDRAPY